MVKSRAEFSETHCVDRTVPKEEKIWLWNTAPWDPVLILVTGTSRAAWIRPKKDEGFWEQKHGHEFKRKETALAEGFRQHFKVYHAWRNVGMQLLTGTLCGCVCLPLYRLCVRTTAKSLHMPYKLHVQSDSCSERAPFPWREATWSQVELALCSLSVCDHESCTSKIMRLPGYEGIKELLDF